MKSNIFNLAFIILFIHVLSGFSLAEDFVCPSGQYLKSVDPSKASGCFQVPENQIGTQRDLNDTVPSKYLKVVSGLLVEKTSQEKSDQDAAEAASALEAQRTNSRASAKSSVDELSAEGVRLRASLLVILDEINALRAASVPALPARTASQMKTAIKNKIDNGLAD